MIFCCISGAAMMLFISSWSLVTMSRGVSWRAKMTCHDTASRSGIPTASASGGTSGSDIGDRLRTVWVRHMGHIETELLFQQFRGQMGCSADAGGAVAD